MFCDDVGVSIVTLDCLIRERFDRPLRPKLQEVLTVIRASDDPELACQKVVESGIVGPDLFSSSHRRFGPHEPGICIQPSDRPSPAVRPTSLAMVIAIAADEDGILHAESAACEFAKRLAPFQAIFSGGVVWYLTENAFRKSYPFETTGLGQSFFAIGMTLTLCLDSAGIDIKDYRIGMPSERMPLLVHRALAAWEGWRVAQRLDLSVTEDVWPVDRYQFTRFRELPNPFAPLLELWLTGYRISADFNDKYPAVHLYANPSDIGI